MKKFFKPTFFKALPVIVQKPLDKSVVENEGTTFKCSSTGYPAPTVDWQFNGRSVSIDPRFVIKSDGTLVMERLKVDKFKCCKILWFKIVDTNRTYNY